MTLSPVQRGLAEGAAVALAGVGAWIWFVQPSPNFTWDELTTTTYDLDNTPGFGDKLRLIKLSWTMLEPLRMQFGPIRVTSAFRSPEVNAAIPGSSTSSHMEGNGADIYVWDNSASNEDMARWIYDNRSRFPFMDQTIVERHTGHLHIAQAPNLASASPRGQFLQYDGATYTDWEP